MTKKNDNISEAVERLLFFMNNRGVTGYKINKDIPSISQQQISHIRNGRNDLSLEIATKIADTYNISLDWLLTGKGEMLNDNADNSPKTDDPYLITKCGTKYYELPFGKFRMRVPLVPIEAYAKYIDEYRDAELINDYSEVEFIVDKIGRGQYLAFEVKGDSMDNGLIKSIPNGSIVLARNLQPEHWKSNLRTKDFPFWVIVLDNTILVKEIASHDVENGVITCHSLNDAPEYEDFDINLSDVKQLLNIVAKQIF